MAHRTIKSRFLYTVREAMALMHVSTRRQFLQTYVDSGLIGIYSEPGTGRILIPKADLEAAITKRLYYKGVSENA
ncbi:MAG: helix-turn-helix domain-containing protein [Syntrophomonadaceae bacterium]